MLMDVPSLDDTMPDNERLTRALRKYLNINRVRIPYVVLKKLPDVLRENNFAVKCVIRATSDDMYVYDIFGKDEDVVIGGLAIDIGTTTVSAVLINMENGEILAKSSAGNGQIRFGADVINRIVESQKPGGQKKGCGDQGDYQSNDPRNVQECKISQRPYLQDVCGIQYNYESSVCRNQCGSVAYRALYPCIL